MGWFICICFLVFLFHSQVNFSLAFSSNSSSTKLCPRDETIALLEFKNNFSFNNSASSFINWDGRIEVEFCRQSYPKMLSWEEGTNCCSWDGVSCDRVSGHVIGIDLSCSWLNRTIHSNTTLFLLPHLQSLNLAFNFFYPSPISPQFGRFTSLTYLNLSSSFFQGHIPTQISHLSKLVSLDLSSYYENLLILDTRSFKKLAQNLTKLRQLDLSYVSMSSVELGSLRNLSSSLTFLNLRYCGLGGKFFDNIFHLSNLQKLDLVRNRDLIDYFPKANWSSPIGNLQSLNYLDLSVCGFFGFIPASLGNLTQITHLDLSYNQFSSFIPASLGNLTQITQLDLSYNRFSGFIPASIGNLTQITYLDLSSNQFSGEIPSILSNLKQLTNLNLGLNNFRGCIPTSIANLTRLDTLDLQSNRLVGPIPSQIFPNLYTLFLYNNSLNGTIPSWVFTLPSLVDLDLSYNQLTGPIHEFQYYSLEYVRLESNELHGPLPKSIFQLVNLTDLVLSSNKLSGIVEMHEFSKLQNLYTLELSYNSLSLSIDNNVNFTLPNLHFLSFSSYNLSEFPNFLRNQDTLQWLDLSQNKIHGSIPKWVWDMGKDSLYYLNLSSNYLTSAEQFPWKNLQYLDLHSNLLQGEIHFSICNVSSLVILNLSNNSLSGIIPECLGNFSNYLSMLDLRMNNFHGTIPRTFATDNSLRTVNLNGNQLEGSVPSSLINCQNLEVLDLGNNRINDTFPFWFESLLELQVLVLRSNKFHGSITSSKAQHPFPKLRILDLSNNDFKGPLPERYFKNLKAMMNVNEKETKLEYMGELAYYKDSVILTIKGFELNYVRILTTLTTIDLSKNGFQGEIPKSIGKLLSIRELNFSHNNLMGHIPAELENLRVLESLDLSSNNIIGEIPGKLTSLTFLEFLNLSQNHLVGRIPQGNQFNTFQNNSYFGNRGLGGLPLSKKCNYDEAPPPPPPMVVQEEDNLVFTSGFGWKAVLMGYGCGIVFGLGMGYLMFLTRKPKWLLRIIEKEFLHVERRMNKNARRRRQGRIWQIQVGFLGTEIKA